MLRKIAVVCATLLLGGCYETGYELFSMTGGVKMPIRDGLYNCVDEKNEPEDPVEVKSRANGDKHIYAMRDIRKSGPTDWADHSFHKIAGDRYVVVFKGSDQLPGQAIALIEVRGTNVLVILITQAREQELQKEYGVGDSFKLIGTPDQQRAFIHQAAIEKQIGIAKNCWPRA